jgi:hypothetical protein
MRSSKPDVVVRLDQVRLAMQALVLKRISEPQRLSGALSTP